MAMIEVSDKTYKILMETKEALNNSRLLFGHADTDEELIEELVTTWWIYYDEVADAVWDGE